MTKELKSKKEVILPVIPLRGVSVFPHMVTHFDVGRKKSVEALEEAMLADSLILLTTQKDVEVENPEFDDFYQIGTISRVKQMLRLPGGSIRVLAEGLNRGRIIDFLDNDDYIEARIEEVDAKDYETVTDEKDIEAIRRLVLADLEEYIRLNPRMADDVILAIRDIKSPGRLSDIVSSYIHLDQDDNQKLLEEFDEYQRLKTLHEILRKEIELLEIEEKIDSRVKTQMDKVQKEYYLREQMKAIQMELGEGETTSDEVEEYIEKIKALKLDEEIEEKVLKEAERLETISPHSPEYGVIMTYLDWIIDLPWNEESEDNKDLKKSREILNEDHYGLEDVKERILEFIAVRQMTDSMKGPILCLVGPPGVGKTSIARSVADAMNRNFVRMSLGGVRDEAEIRGHRRTYVGSMPGRIINSMKEAGSMNPVFLLDEIDKIGSDFRGDPASGLLEVLDPEQNSTFKDHYLDIPFDLSKVLFLTTANNLATIPAPLLDRMEVIEINSYTEDEKLQIAKRHLLPKQIEEHGLSESQLQVSDAALEKIIRNYTREAGVRNLEREIASICRKSVKRIIEEDLELVRISVNSVSNYLGVEKYISDTIEEENQIGVAKGLAWTAVGGETLSIEVNVMKGKGKVQLTGQLGDVMKESAMAGISYIRSNMDKLGIEDEFYKDKDIHIHVPEGSIPKDGPSAGVTMATAVISALTNKEISKEVAMTGEVTLRGRVLPVGGIKEKTLAAHRLGIKKVLLPYENKKELEEVPDRVKREIEFVLIKSMDDVLKHALVEDENRDENK